MRKISINKDILYAKYIVENKTIEVLSKELGVDKRVIIRNLLENGINRKTDFINTISKEQLHTMYIVEKLSQREIAKRLNVSSGTIKLTMAQFEILARNKSWRSQENKTGRLVRCEMCGKEIYRKGSKIKDRKIFLCSRKCTGEYQRIPESEKGWRSQHLYRNWRKAIFKRDNYVCKLCGDSKKICSHHILEAQEYTNKKYDKNNGITLCKTCHIFVHKNNSHNFIQSLKEAIS